MFLIYDFCFSSRNVSKIILIYVSYVLTEKLLISALIITYFLFIY